MSGTTSWSDRDVFTVPVPPGELALARLNGYNAVAVRTAETSLVFDPIGLRLDNLGPVDLVAITHEHADHWDAASVRAILEGSAAEVVAPAYVASRLRDWGSRVRALTPGDRVQRGDLEIEALPSHHPAREPLAFLLRTQSGVTLFHPGDDPPPPEVSQRFQVEPPDMLLYLGTSFEAGALAAEAVCPGLFLTYGVEPEAAQRRAQGILMARTQRPPSRPWASTRSSAIPAAWPDEVQSPKPARHRRLPMSPIRLEVRDHVALVTIDYPPVNALGPDAFGSIAETFDSLHGHHEARVAVLTAAGRRAFCAGVDIGGGSSRSDHGRAARESFNAICECPLPVIGAINGPALGAGIAIAASCDYLIASENATFGLPEIDVGLLGGARHAGRLFPQGVTRRMHYTAERLDAREAYRLGAVIRVVPPDQLMAEAMKEAAIVAAKMPAGIALAKENLNMIEWMDLKNGYRFEQTRTTLLQRTEDAKEAARAFVEKRPPKFTGS